MYPDSQIIYVKAGLVSQFRQNELQIMKSRRVNDFHHGKDAYLNIVVGNVYHTKFTSNPLKWISENRNQNYSINKVFYHDVYVGDRLVWCAPKKGNPGTLKRVREIMQKNNLLYTEYSYCEKGELFNATIKKKVPYFATLAEYMLWDIEKQGVNAVDYINEYQKLWKSDIYK